MDDEYGAVCGMNGRGKPKYLEKTFPLPRANLTTKNPTSSDLGEKPYRCEGRPAINA
jgi:hypothetical protein